MPKAQSNTSALSGIIRNEHGAPLSGITVSAYDKDLRTEELLGKAVTDAHGRYQIKYDNALASKTDHRAADIFIRVQTKQGRKLVELGRSPVHFNAPPKLELDFKIGGAAYKGTPEFEALVQTVQPLLDGQQVRMADLKEDDEFKDLSFLTNETGEDAGKIALLPIAHRFAETSSIPPDIFYGLFRMQYPQQWHALLLVKSESLRQGLAAAIEQNIISSKWERQLKGFLEKLNQLATEFILSGKEEENVAFQKMIGAAIPKAAMQKTFVDTYFTHEATPEKFWEALAAKEGFRDGKAIAEIKTLLRLNHLTDYEPALTALLYAEHTKDPELNEIRGFAKFTRQDWETRIARLVASGELKKFPEGIEGDTPEAKTKNYARAMEDLLRLIYPVEVFLRRMNEDTGHPFGETKGDLRTFLTNNPDFDLRTNRINNLFEAWKWDGIRDKEALQGELKSINRLYKLAPRYEDVSALRREGIGSATALVQKFGESQFVEKFSGVFDQKTASLVYKRAKQIDMRSTALVLGHKMRNDITLYAIQGENGLPPDYQSMFGDNQLCDCSHCQSVYSPSAYLVDMLHFMQQNNMAAYDQLNTRRPDLKDLLLTCKNTNTPLPYIDLVNEVLEYFITTGIAAHQTNNTAAELAAYPEHVNSAASAKLKTAFSSFQLPLNLPLEEIRRFTDKLNLQRPALMELFFGKNGEHPYKDVAIAAEYLKLSQQELKMINGTTPAPIVALDRVSSMLQKTGLSYVELLQLLECYFINPVDANGKRSIFIVAETGGDPKLAATCDIDKLIFSGGENAAPKISPFIRLWKKLGWNMLDLDRAFTALGIADLNLSAEEINVRLIVPLSHVARLKARFNLSVPDMLAFWSALDTAAYTDYSKESQPQIFSLYDQLFQNKKVSNPVDPDFANPAGLNGTLAGKSSLIIAALNIAQSEFDWLLQSPLTDGALNLHNLSVLYRYATLAKASKISIEDLLLAAELTGQNPFGDNTQTASTLLFLEELAFLRSAGFSLKDLNALLRKTAEVTQQPNSNKIAGVFSALREGLQKIDALFPEAKTNSEQAANKLLNQKAYTADTLSNAFKTESKLAGVLLNDLVKSAADHTLPALTPFIDPKFIKSDDSLFSFDPSGQIIWAFPNLYDTYNLLETTSARIGKLMAKLKISTEEFIYFQHHEAVFHLTGIWNLPQDSSGSGLFAAFQNLANIIRFRNALAIVPPDWFIMFDYALSNGTDAKKNFIERLAALSNMPKETTEFLLGSALDVSATGMLRYTFPDDYLSGSRLFNVIQCHHTAQKAGSAVENISLLATLDPGDNETQLAKSILKAKYDESTWLSVIKPISNQLREKKRDALTAYILTAAECESFRNENGIVHANSLFEYFLIDLEMAACMMTSRIKQAIGSVQIFIDRCLMGLESESGITLSAEFATQWNAWRKQYRVWEANRKIFLYPENWIEPNLRDDKSPFFKELEARLKQNEVTEETAKEALLEYLEKLDVVSNLEIIGLYPDELTGLVHVIGRTKNIPHQYYYRKQEKSQWSAWEKIDLDIEGNHLLPVVWNNRLMLFWGMFSEKQEQQEGISLKLPPLEAGGNITSNSPQKYLEIKLAWSEYKNGKWSSKKISKTGIRGNNHVDVQNNVIQGLKNLEYISMNSFFENGKLIVKVFQQGNKISGYDMVVGSFIFNSCNSFPSTSTGNIHEIDKIRRPPSMAAFETFIIGHHYFNQRLIIYESGLYKKNQDAGKSPRVTILQKNFLNYELLPVHHEVLIEKPTIFIYSNVRDNFYAHSVNTVSAILPDDIAVVSSSNMIARKRFDPILVTSVDNNSVLTHADFSPPSTTTSIDPPSPGEIYLPPSRYIVKKYYKFQSFYHPYVCDFIKVLNTYGIEGLYKGQWWIGTA